MLNYLWGAPFLDCSKALTVAEGDNGAGETIVCFTALAVLASGRFVLQVRWHSFGSLLPNFAWVYYFLWGGEGRRYRDMNDGQKTFGEVVTSK